jgi:protein-disulfide reductase (glutathione)
MSHFKLFLLFSLSILFLSSFVSFSEAKEGGESHGSSRGFNDNIDWYNNLEEAIAAGKEEGKPVFVLIHKTWCGACKRLKADFPKVKWLDSRVK